MEPYCGCNILRARRLSPLQSILPATTFALCTLTLQTLQKARLADASCAGCHGANGISTTAAVPNLAGQRPAYLYRELRKCNPLGVRRLADREEPPQAARGAPIKRNSRLAARSETQGSDAAAHYSAHPPHGCFRRSSLCGDDVFHRRFVLQIWALSRGFSRGNCLGQTKVHGYRVMQATAPIMHLQISRIVLTVLFIFGGWILTRFTRCKSTAISGLSCNGTAGTIRLPPAPS